MLSHFRIRRRPLRRHAPFVTFLILMLLMGGAVQCIEAPLAPVAPASTIELSIPLANRLRTGEDLVKKGGALRIGSDGGFVYEANQSFTPIPLPQITVSPKPSNQQVGVGTFSIGTLPASVNTLKALPEGTFPVPSQTTTVPGVSLDAIPSLDYVSITQGSLSLRIVNNYPVGISFPDTIILRNNTLNDTSDVASFVFSTSFQTSQSQTAVSNLSGKLLRSLLQIRSFRLSTPGSGLDSVTIGSNSGIIFEFTSTELKADSASAIIPSQPVFSVANAQLEIDDSVAIQDARFKSGNFTAAIINNLDITVGVFLQFDNFRNVQTNAPFQIASSIPARDSLLVPINASALRIASDSLRTLGTSLTYSVGIQTINSGTAKKTVKSTDFVRAELRVGSQPFAVGSVTGRIKPTRVEINTGASGVYELGEAQKKLSGQFKFDSVRVAMSLPITGSFITDYDLWLVAENRRVTPMVIDSIRMPINSTTGRRRILPTIGGPPPVIVLDKHTNFDEFLGRFFPNLPDTFMVRGHVLLNPPDVFSTPQGVQSIWDTTKIYPGVGLRFPSRLGIANGLLTDTVDLGNSAKFPKDFVNSLNSGTMFLEITNGLGFELLMRAYLLRYLNAVPETLLTITPTKAIAAATVDAFGNVSQPKISDPKITLTGSDLAKFDLATTLGIRLDLATSGGGSVPIKIRSTDFIRIKASLNVQYTVNKPK